MAFTYIRVTRTYELATDVPAAGSVRFRPIDRMVNGLTVVSAPVTATLDGSGAIDVRLAATTDSATRPIGVTYEVREQITGQTPVTYYVSIPHTAPAGTVDLSTLSVISPVDAGAFSLVDAADYDDTTPPAAGNAIVWNAAVSKWHPAAGAAAGVSTINGESPDGAGNIVISPSDVGAQPADADLTGLGGLGDGYPKRAAGAWSAQTASQLATDLVVPNTTPITLTASGGVITPTASSGWLFRHTAAANVTLANPTGGTDGQLVVVEVFASGADRIVTLPAGSSPATVTVTSGTWHPFEQRNHSGTWQTIDYLAATSGNIPADGSVTNVKVSGSAAISADKLADGTANKVMTAAERTKLAGLPTAPVDATLVDAKGDLIVATADNAVARLAVGTNGQVLTANSATSSGLAWSASAGGGYATVQDEGTARTQRSAVNFVGAGVTVTDDAPNSRTVVTIPGAGGGGADLQILSATDYGAVGDGVANDTAALQAWLNALPGGGHGYLPPGEYRITSGLILDENKTDVLIEGAGNIGQTGLVGTGASVITVNGSIVGLTCGTTASTMFMGVMLRNIHFQAGTGTPLGGILILRQNNFVLENVGCSGFTSGYGIHSDGTGNVNQYGQYQNPSINDCAVGLKFTESNGMRVFGGMFDGNENSGTPRVGSIAIQQISGDSLRIFGVIMQFYATGVYLTSHEAHEIHGCRFEGFVTGIRMEATAGAKVFGGSFNCFISGEVGTTAISIGPDTVKTALIAPYIIAVETELDDQAPDTLFMRENLIWMKDPNGRFQIGNTNLDRSRVVVERTSDFTTTATTFVDMLTTTFETNGTDRISVAFSGIGNHSAANGVTAFQLAVDATTRTMGQVINGGNANAQWSVAREAVFTGLTVGATVTVTLRARVTAGTFTCRAGTQPALEGMTLSVTNIS